MTAAADRPGRVAAGLFHGVAVVAVLVVTMPFVLPFFTPPFADRWAGALLFAMAAIERLWAMYLRRGLACTQRAAGRDWTASVSKRENSSHSTLASTCSVSVACSP